MADPTSVQAQVNAAVDAALANRPVKVSDLSTGLKSALAGVIGLAGVGGVFSGGNYIGPSIPNGYIQPAMLASGVGATTNASLLTSGTLDKARMPAFGSASLQDLSCGAGGNACLVSRVGGALPINMTNPWVFNGGFGCKVSIVPDAEHPVAGTVNVLPTDCLIVVLNTGDTGVATVVNYDCAALNAAVPGKRFQVKDGNGVDGLDGTITLKPAVGQTLDGQTQLIMNTSAAVGSALAAPPFDVRNISCAPNNNSFAG